MSPNQSPVPLELSNENRRTAIMRGIMHGIGFAFALWFMGFWAWQAWELRRIANVVTQWRIDIGDTSPYFPPTIGDKKK